jgi:hypothetical protein
MVREPGAIAAVSRVDLREHVGLAPESGALRAVFCLGDKVEFQLPRGESGALMRRDTLLYEEVNGPVSLRATDQNALVLVFAWRPANAGSPA